MTGGTVFLVRKVENKAILIVFARPVLFELRMDFQISPACESVNIFAYGLL